MFDSLSRRFLPPYGCDWVHAPNFSRLAARSVTFDTCYAGSMPCIPARREMHTGRYNFLHRSWGPLEPFDDSVPDILHKAGVYSHLVTDHQHYWEDGGATYHNRFDSYEFFRGQEGDAWKGHVPDVAERAELQEAAAIRRQDRVNRAYYADERDHPQTRVFDAGIDFVRTNADEERWLLQIETFDPHEPFFSYERHRELYPQAAANPGFDWPAYRRVTETEAEIQSARAKYAALISMCDASLGRLMDVLDAEDLWGDTLLVVCTDHGFLLGEHGWWAKTVQPWYDENIHTPFFVWDPRSGVKGERRKALVQTIDIGPTLLDYFGAAPTADMEGRPLATVVANDTSLREAALFGAFGAHVNVTDGRYVYMRAPDNAANAPLLEHTLMPTHMRGMFSPAELAAAELVPPLPFSKGIPLLRLPGRPLSDDRAFEVGTLLFDLEADPAQQHPLADAEIELRMIELMLGLMRRNHAPASQYQRLGLPMEGAADLSHTRARR
jgi:arylsulfatase A-like enzyme